MFIVYMLTNQISGKSYLGYSSKTVEDRFTTHIRYAESGGTTHLAKAIRKYPIDSWKLETLIQNIETKPEALAKEIELIAFYNTFPFGYNLTSGGERGYHTIKSKESCLKISKALKGRKLSQATKDKMTKSQQSWISKLSSEERLKIWGRFGKCNGFYRKHHSEETKAKIQETKQLNNTQTKSGKLNPFFGKHHTEETKKKIQETKQRNGTIKFGSSNPAAKAVTIYGVTYPTIIAACTALNTDRYRLRKLLEKLNETSK